MMYVPGLASGMLGGARETCNQLGRMLRYFPKIGR